jgi:hypothetical protein
VAKAALPFFVRGESMVTWLKDNVLALLLIAITGVGAYSLSISRIAVLEVKVDKQETDNVKTDKIIENNTAALNKIYVLFATEAGKREQYEYRLEVLEKHEEERNEQRITRTGL